MNRPGPAKGNHRILAGVQPLFQDMYAGRISHIFIDDAKNPHRSFFHRDAQWMRQFLRNGRDSFFPAQRHRTAEKIRFVQVAE